MSLLLRPCATAAAFIALGLASAASAHDLASVEIAPDAPPTAQVTVERLLSSGKTIIGEELAYPTGTPKITAVIVTLPAGAETGWHVHEVPLFGYMLEGELTVDYGSNGIHTYRPGDAFLEAFLSDHNGINTGNGPAKVLAVFAGSEEAQNTVQSPH